MCTAIIICNFSLGWSSEMDNGALVLSGAGPEETLCMTVAGDFSWTVSY